MDRIYTIIGVVFACIIILALITKFHGIYKYAKNGSTLYEIEVNSYKNNQTYFTDDFQRDTVSGCIKFIEEFGIKRTVCNNYTITEF